MTIYSGWKCSSVEVNFSINVSQCSHSLPSLHDLTHETVVTRESNTAEDSRWRLRHFGQSQRSIFVACGVAPRWPARTHLLVPYRKYDRGTDHLYGTTLLLLFSPCNWETLREGRSERRDCVISRFQELLFLLKWSSLRTWLLLWGQTSSRRMSTCGPDVLEQNPQVDIYLWFVNCIWQYSMTRSILRVSILFF